MTSLCNAIIFFKESASGPNIKNVESASTYIFAMNGESLRKHKITIEMKLLSHLKKKFRHWIHLTKAVANWLIKKAIHSQILQQSQKIFHVDIHIYVYIMSRIKLIFLHIAIFYVTNARLF